VNNKSNGFTLVELIVVMAIIGIIIVIAVPRLAGFGRMAEESVCAFNRKTVERVYSAFLDEYNIDHTDSIFNQFIIDNFDKICPAGRVTRYEDGKAKCNLHEDESSGNEVPWL